MKWRWWANRLWVGANLLRWRRYSKILDDPDAAQGRILQRYLRSNAGTAFGKAHCFERIGSVEDFQRRVPLSTYDDYAPLIDRIRRGEAGVLTREPVRRLVPTGGSTGARKLIPYTDALLREFQRGIGPWIVDLHRLHPGLRGGAEYWAISPAMETPPAEGAGLAKPRGAEAIPIGFDEDRAYLGGLAQRLVDRILAVPGAVRQARDLTTFRYLTLLHLLLAGDLCLISIWHPSFLTLLLEPLAQWWDRLVEDVERGALSPPGPIDATLKAELAARLRPDRRRASELRAAGPGDLRRIWPRLGIISCWGDAHAETSLESLARQFPQVPLQRKGLLATEAFVTLPFRGARPLAVVSHFFEFLDDRGAARRCGELRAGAEYSVVATTAGGLYRYRLQDRVRVESFVGRTPSLLFLGKEEGLSDRVGEKLSEGHAAEALRRALAPRRLEVSFAMLAPDERREGLGYTLYLESGVDPPPGLREELEEALSASPSYRYSVALGQLRSALVFRITERAQHAYLERCQRLGRKLGDIKPAALSRETGWSEWFRGDYLRGDGA